MSVATRVRSLALAALSTVLTLTATPARAQDQGPPPTSRDFCIKIAPGKGAEFRAFLSDVLVPLAQARADAGEFAWYVAARSLYPAGSSATCDYRIVFGYEGLPPEPAGAESLEAGLKAAKLDMTRDQFLAKRNSLASLVAAEIWAGIDYVGPQTEKGSYVRANRYDVHSGDMGEWVRMERTYWKALMEAWLKQGGKGSWGVYQLWMPGGDNVPYDAMTLDFFPDWNGLVQGVPAEELWDEVLPGTTPTDTFNRMDGVRSVHSRDVYRLEEVVRAK